MSLLYPLRKEIDDLCKEISQIISESERTTGKRALIEALSAHSVDVEEIERMLRSTGRVFEYDNGDDDNYGYTEEWFLFNRLRVAWAQLKSMETQELHDLQQSAKASSGLPSNASCH